MAKASAFSWSVWLCLLLVVVVTETEGRLLNQAHGLSTTMRFLNNNHLWRRLKSHKRTKRLAAYKANERILEEVEGRIQSAVEDLETRYRQVVNHLHDVDHTLDKSRKH